MKQTHSSRVGSLVGIVTLAALFAAATLHVIPIAAQSAGAPVTSFYDLKTKTLDGKPADLAMYRGKVSLVVNVASKCGYTPQYEGLEKLHKDMQGKTSTFWASRATISAIRSRARRKRSRRSANSPTASRSRCSRRW